jgi:hypothetical protein
MNNGRDTLKSITGMRGNLAMIKTLVTAVLLTHSWYDPYCCNTKDCHPVSGKVERMEGGWQAEGHFFPESMQRDSQDAEFHVCIFHGQARCIYVPKDLV